MGAESENQPAQVIVDAAYQIHREIGPGLLESAYEQLLAYELSCRGCKVERQVPVGLRYRSLVIDDAFRADLIVDERVIVEVKAVEQLAAVHRSQLFTYLRLTDKRLGLLINFNTALLRDGVRRVANRM